MAYGSTDEIQDLRKALDAARFEVEVLQHRLAEQTTAEIQPVAETARETRLVSESELRVLLSDVVNAVLDELNVEWAGEIKRDEAVLAYAAGVMGRLAERDRLAAQPSAPTS